MASRAITRGFTVLVEPGGEDGPWLIRVPDLPGCRVASTTLDGALERIGPAVDRWRESREAEGFLVGSVPVWGGAEEFRGRFSIRIPTSLHAAVARLAEREETSINMLVTVALADAVVRGSAAAPRSYVWPLGGAVNRWRYLRSLKRDDAVARRKRR